MAYHAMDMAQPKHCYSTSLRATSLANFVPLGSVAAQASQASKQAQQRSRFLRNNKNSAGQHSPGRNVGGKNRLFEKKPRQGNTHPDAMCLFIDASICMHMYAHCIHIEENWLEMLTNVEQLLNLMFPTLCMMVLDFFQTTNLAFATFYGSEQVLMSKVYRKT